MSDTTDSEQENKRTRRSSAGSNDPTCPVSHSGGKELINAVVPTDVDTLFNMLFTDSEFLRKLRADRKTTGTISHQDLLLPFRSIAKAYGLWSK